VIEQREPLSNPARRARVNLLRVARVDDANGVGVTTHQPIRKLRALPPRLSLISFALP
jgi:hypothetical protein